MHTPSEVREPFGSLRSPREAWALVPPRSVRQTGDSRQGWHAHPCRSGRGLKHVRQTLSAVRAPIGDGKRGFSGCMSGWHPTDVSAFFGPFSHAHVARHGWWCRPSGGYAESTQSVPCL